MSGWLAALLIGFIAIATIPRARVSPGRWMVVLVAVVLGYEALKLRAI